MHVDRTIQRRCPPSPAQVVELLAGQYLLGMIEKDPQEQIVGPRQRAALPVAVDQFAGDGEGGKAKQRLLRLLRGEPEEIVQDRP